MMQTSRRILLEIAALVALSALASGLAIAFHPAPVPWSEETLAEDEMSLAQALALGDKVLWVDARSRSDYEAAHIPGALLLNEDEWSALLAQFLPHWHPDKTIVVYCSATECQASRHVVQRLAENSIKRAFVLKGGWDAWSARQPVTE